MRFLYGPFVWIIMWLWSKIEIPSPAALQMHEWRAWRKEKRKKYPIRYYLTNDFESELHFFKRFLFEEPHYWIRFRTWEKHHVIKIETLSPGWCDKDTIILHSTFQVLVNFMEKERPDEIINWNSDKEHIAAWSEMSFLYRWWKVTRPNRKEIEGPNLDWKYLHDPNNANNEDVKEYHEYLRAHMKQEEEWVEEDTEMAVRVIKVRRFMWT